MTTLIRTLVYLSLLVLFGVGIRLMYYGLQIVVGSSPHFAWSDVVLMLVGVLFFISAIITGVLFLSPPRSPAQH